jgi:hypothetical protein
MFHWLIAQQQRWHLPQLDRTINEGSAVPTPGKIITYKSRGQN